MKIFLNSTKCTTTNLQELTRGRIEFDSCNNNVVVRINIQQILQFCKTPLGKRDNENHILTEFALTEEEKEALRRLL